MNSVQNNERSWRWPVITPEEEKIMTQFVLDNPYPEYECLSENLDFRLSAEYGKINHNLCKCIYENPCNGKLIVEMGKKIFDRGGFTALQANHIIISSLFRKSEDLDAKYWGQVIEVFFMDVTPDWNC